MKRKAIILSFSLVLMAVAPAWANKSKEVALPAVKVAQEKPVPTKQQAALALVYILLGSQVNPAQLMR